MKLSADELRKIGTVLYGRQWQTPMAHLLNVGERSMRRYAKNGIKIDWKRQRKLVEQINSHRRALLAWLDAIVARADFGPD